MDGVCIAQCGGEQDGAIVAYDLDSGDEIWTCAADGGTTYSSPVLLDLDGTQAVVAETTKSVIGINLEDGEQLWETPFVISGRGYNAATPIVHSGKVILAGSGRGTRVAAIEKKEQGFAVKEIWVNEDNSVQFNTPIVKDGFLYGLSDRDVLFCVDVKTGATAWSAPISAPQAEAEQGEGEADRDRAGRRGRGGRRGGRGGGGFGSLVDAGPVIFALTPKAQLVVLAPSEKELTEIARYEVSDSPTYAYPIINGNRIYIKDQSSLALWTIGSSL